MRNVIGLDVGHSAVKLASTVGGKQIRLTIPSFVCPAFEIADEAEQRRADKETVTLDGRAYFFGETARIQGQMKNPVGTFDNWITGSEHGVLLLGALKNAAAHGVDIDRPRLVLGLPTHLFARQKGPLKEIVANLVKTEQLIVMPQPVGAYQSAMLDEYGVPVPTRSITDQTWGVVDIGYYTTDFLVMQKGRFVQNAMGSCAGMRMAAEHLVSMLTKQGLSTDIQEAEEALINRSIKDFTRQRDVGAEVDSALSKNVTEVLDTLGRLISGIARKMDGLVVAGGGASLIYPFIRSTHSAALLVPEPRFAIAEGMRRYGCAVSCIKSVTSAVAGAA